MNVARPALNNNIMSQSFDIVYHKRHILGKVFNIGDFPNPINYTNAKEQSNYKMTVTRDQKDSKLAIEGRNYKGVA